MGAAASQESIRKKEGEIIAYHQEIDTAYNSLREKANVVKQEIIRRQYNDENLICQRIVWTNIDELASFFPVETVQRPNFNAKYRLGVLPSENIEKLLNNKKLQTCKNIASLYKAKITLLDKLINSQNCQSMAKLEWAELRGKLSKIDPNSSDLEKWTQIYNELQAFNKTIITDYKRLDNHLTSIRKATSLDTLTDINKRIQNVFAEMDTTCQKHSAYFKSVNASKTSPTVSPVSSPVIAKKPLSTDKAQVGKGNTVTKSNTDLADSSDISDESLLARLDALRK